jgi:hypothetical protein
MATPAPPRKRRGPTRPATVDYRPGILGIVQVASFPLAIAGRSNPVLALDAAAVTLHAPALAEAINALAMDHPEVAAVLDRIMSVGPYGALIGALVPIVVQIASNHEMIPGPVAESLGALSRDELVRKMQAYG